MLCYKKGGRSCIQITRVNNGGIEVAEMQFSEINSSTDTTGFKEEWTSQEL